MKYIVLFILTTSSIAMAHCPVEITHEDTEYCLSVDWLTSDQKVKGELTASNNPSPQLVAMGTHPGKWMHSKAAFLIWKKSDSTHTPQVIENFKVFPFMHMQSGHNHSTSHNFRYSTAMAQYILSAVVFQEMPGCWTLRWSTSDSKTLETSELLMDITSYKNLDTSGNEAMNAYCQSANKTNSSEDHHSHH